MCLALDVVKLLWWGPVRPSRWGPVGSGDVSVFVMCSEVHHTAVVPVEL